MLSKELLQVATFYYNGDIGVYGVITIYFAKGGDLI